MPLDLAKIRARWSKVTRPSWHMEGPLWLPDYETTGGGILVPCQLADTVRNGGDMRGMVMQAPAPAPETVLQWDFSSMVVVFNPIGLIKVGKPASTRAKPTCVCGCTRFFRRCLRRGFTDGQCKKCGRGRRRPFFDKKLKKWIHP